MSGCRFDSDTQVKPMKFWLLLTAALLSFQANADTRLNVQQGQKQHVLEVQGAMVRMSGPNTRGGYLLFNSQKQQAAQVLPNERSYFMLNPEALQQRLQLMQQMLKQLSPERLAQMQQRFPGLAAAGKLPQLQVKPLGGKKMASYPCQAFQVMANGKLDSEVCLATAQTLGITPQEANSIRQLMIYLGSLSGQDRALKPLQKIPGLPVSVTRFRQGQAFDRSFLSQVENGKWSPERFQIPAGFKEVSMPLVPFGG